MTQLDGKVVAVTGASSGSGLAIARRFAAEGAHVVLLARGKERLDEAASTVGPRAVAIVADVGDPVSVASAFDEIERRYDKLDVLVNHAAIYRPCAVESLTDFEIERQLLTNLAGPVYTCRAAIPLLRAADGGDIVNTSSESTLHPFPLLSLYVATKAGLEAFGRVLAEELRNDDIRVTTVVQGATSGGGSSSTDWGWDPDQGAAAMALWAERGLLLQAQGRLGGQDNDDIAEVHLFIVTRPRRQKLDTVHCRSC